MSKQGVSKYYPGSIVVDESVVARGVETDQLNGTDIEEYITEKDIPNAPTLKGFNEKDGGLLWNGVALVPPNSVQTDRPYVGSEITSMVNEIWENYDGSLDDDKISEEVNTDPDGNLTTDWKSRR